MTTSNLEMEQAAESNFAGVERRSDVEGVNLNDHDIQLDRAQGLLAQFKAAWSRATEAGSGSTEDHDKVYDVANSMACQVIEFLVKSRIDEFHRSEQATRSLNVATERIQSMERELARTRTSEAKGREAISNLLKAVATSKSEAREESRAAKEVVNLRAEVNSARAARDDAWKEANECKRKATLLEDELQLTRAKLSRFSQEKIKLERENRAAKLKANKSNSDNQSASDCDFYKRKVAALQSHVQSLEAVLGEKKHEVHELRRQIERSLSQNRLANLRADQNRKRSI